MADQALILKDLKPQDVPDDLKPETYFGFKAHPFAHEALFSRPDVNSVYGAILAIGAYAKQWLEETIDGKKSDQQGLQALSGTAPNEQCHTVGEFEVLLEPGAVFEPAHVIGTAEGKPGHCIYVESGASVIGSDIYLDGGSIYIGSGTTVETGVGIKGPTIIGEDCEIRQGAYLRGNCILGRGCTIRGELKNVVMMDKGTFPHPSYLGDSLCGYMTHFGNQGTAANLGIYEGVRQPDKRKNIKVRIGGKTYDLGRPKIGIIMGTRAQVGCNSVSDPGAFLGPDTIVYQLSRINKGLYGPNEILKNKPLEHGIIERSPLKPLK